MDIVELNKGMILTLNLGLNFRCVPYVHLCEWISDASVDQISQILLTVCVVGQIPHSHDAVDGGGGQKCSRVRQGHAIEN